MKHESASATAVRPDSIFDREAALAQADGDTELLRKLVHLLESEIREAVSRIERSLTESDLEAVARACHRLRGSLSMLQALAASASATTLEEVSRRGEVVDVQHAFLDLQSELDRLRPELQAVLEA